jgi:hypothetical protein
MLKKGQISSVKSQMIPSRVVQMPNDPTDPSQGMHPVMMYKILTDSGAGLGTVPLTDELKKELGSKWDNAPVDTTKVPISLLLQNAHTRAGAAQAGGTVSDWQDELKAVDPDNQKLKDFSYSAWSANNPVDAKALNQVLTAHKGQHADIGLNQILTNKDFSGDSKVMSAINKLQQAMGVTADSLTAMADARKTATERAVTAGKPMTAALADQIILDPFYTSDQKKFAQGWKDAQGQNVEDKKAHQLNAQEQADRAFYTGAVAQDKTGWQPSAGAPYMDRKQYITAKQKFTSPAGVYGKAQDVEKSYDMMQTAYGEYKAAAARGEDLPTGAQSMVALSTHLATTFGNVKGARITKDMIQHHLGARSVSDDGLVAIQKLKDGDVLSLDQWDAFHDLISQSRKFTWDNVVENAHAQGLAADALPKGYVPNGATAGRDKAGNIVGYRLPNGRVVDFRQQQ